jgi:hypothetical protein
LGALDNSFLRANHWRLGVEYRFLAAEEWYVGHVYTPDAVPGPHHSLPVRYRIHSVAARVEYAITDRIAVQMVLPAQTGTQSHEEDDSTRHATHATGFGDVAIVGSAWLLNPIAHGNGNVRVGLGIKTPTGNNHVADKFFTTTGVEQRPVDPAIQLGDGGWGGIAEFEAFQAIAHRVSAYAAGAYMTNPGLRTNVLYYTTGATHFVSLADEYSAHAGLSYVALAAGGLSFSLGGRIDGMPVRDLLGASDTSFRRPGYTIYVEPSVALTMTRGPFAFRGHTFSISIPVAVDRNREASSWDSVRGKPGGGDLARFLIFLGYTRRF